MWEGGSGLVIFPLFNLVLAFLVFVFFSFRGLSVLMWSYAYVGGELAGYDGSKSAARFSSSSERFCNFSPTPH